MISTLTNEDTLVLDTGNLLKGNFKGYNPVKHDITINALNLMKYDVLNTGMLDIASSFSYISDSCKKGGFSLISANLSETGPQSPCFTPYIIKNINGIKIGITGILSPDDQFIKTFPDFNAHFKVSDPHTALEAILPEMKSRTDIIILLSSLSATETQVIVETLSDIRLALCTDHKPLDISAPDDLSVLSIMDRGQEIGMIIIEKNDASVKIKDAQRISLDQSIPSDKTIQKQISDFEKGSTAFKRKPDPDIPTEKELLEMLKLSPEEFIKQYNGPKK